MKKLFATSLLASGLIFAQTAPATNQAPADGTATTGKTAKVKKHKKSKKSGAAATDTTTQAPK